MQPTQPMDDILTALAEQDDELDGLLAGLDEAGWARPSRCEGWTVPDVVLHLAQTDEMTVASAERRFTRGGAGAGGPGRPPPPRAPRPRLGVRPGRAGGPHRPRPGARLLPPRRPPDPPVRHPPPRHRARRRGSTGARPPLRLTGAD